MMSQFPPAAATTAWRKSSYSGGGGNECVEVAGLAKGIGVRDSKDPNRAPFTVPPTAWASLLNGLASGR